MMPFQDVDPDKINPPAITRPAEDLSGWSIRRETGTHVPELVEALNRSVRPIEKEVPSTEFDCQISNRPANATYKVLYVNGIHTSESDAARSAGLVRSSLGVEDDECSVVYNRQEHGFKSGLKIIGATLSTKLGEKAESECVRELEQVIADTLYTPGSRLTIVGHSQGSLVIHNAFDKVFDEYKQFPETSSVWDEAAPRIEVILYAPLIRTLAPGPQAVALLNSLDLPARGLGIAQRAVASSKHYLGYRPQQAIRTIFYQPDTNDLTNLFFNPKLVHESFQLILDNPEFNFRLLSEDPRTHSPSAGIFSKNLFTSIRDGRRADILHYELIRMGCDTFGSGFARPFVSMCNVPHDKEKLCIGNFRVDGSRLHYLLAFTK